MQSPGHRVLPGWLGTAGRECNTTRARQGVRTPGPTEAWPGQEGGLGVEVASEQGSEEGVSVREGRGPGTGLVFLFLAYFTQHDILRPIYVAARQELQPVGSLSSMAFHMSPHLRLHRKDLCLFQQVPSMGGCPTGPPTPLKGSSGDSNSQRLSCVHLQSQGQGNQIPDSWGMGRLKGASGRERATRTVCSSGELHACRARSRQALGEPSCGHRQLGRSPNGDRAARKG